MFQQVVDPGLELQRVPVSLVAVRLAAKVRGPLPDSVDHIARVLQHVRIVIPAGGAAAAIGKV